MSNKFSDYFLYSPCGNTDTIPPSLPCSDINQVHVYKILSQLIVCNYGSAANTKYLKIVHANQCCQIFFS